MNYQMIKDASIAYADHTAVETVNNFDVFLKLVEARINRHLKTRKLSHVATLPCVEERTYYGLPNDFNGLRSISLVTTNADGSVSTCVIEYRTPEQIANRREFVGQNTGVNYSIIADQIRIDPPQSDDKSIEIIYHAELPPLTAESDTNWLSQDNPHAYISALVAEITKFVKDYEAVAYWEAQAEKYLAEIDSDDEDTMHSGSPLQVRVA